MNGRPPGRRAAASRRLTALRVSVLAGVLMALFVLVGCVLLLGGKERGWSAKASLLVLPRRDIGFASMAGYYETLSRGQVVATFAEMLRLQSIDRSAAERLNLDASTRQGLALTVQVVPDTSIITLQVESATRRAAELMVDESVGQAQTYIGNLGQPYASEIVSSGSTRATKAERPVVPLAAGAAGGALAAGLATQQALLALVRAKEMRRPGRGTPPSGTDASPAGVPDAEGEDGREQRLARLFRDEPPPDATGGKAREDPETVARATGGPAKE